jgi:HAD superfamily hydrolase (TIGR01509 family)
MIFVFDCDGVLVDSEIIASTVDAEHLAGIGYKITPEEVSRRFAGLTSRGIGDIVAAEIGRPLPENFFQKTKVDIDRRLATELKEVPGARALLDRLSGERKCVCSNSSMERLRISLQKTGLYDSLSPHIYSAVEVGNKQPKPDPNVYLHAAAALGIDPKQAVVLEDSVFGIGAAKRAGMRVVGFTGGSHSWPGHADLLTEAGAETVINRLTDFPAIAEAVMSWEGLPD